jgi:hypothetical protein
MFSWDKRYRIPSASGRLGSRRHAQHAPDSVRSRRIPPDSPSCGTALDRDPDERIAQSLPWRLVNIAEIP